MIRIANYELAITSLADENGQVAPIVALSFSWPDVSALPAPALDADNCSLQIVDEGLQAVLAGHDLLFPLSGPGVGPPGGEDGLDREQVLGLIRAHAGLFVCAFNDQGDMVASVGFNRL